jgi:hypothetical protein
MKCKNGGVRKVKEILIIDSNQDNGHVKKTVLKLTEENNVFEPIIWLYYDEKCVLKVYLDGYVEMVEKHDSIVNTDHIEEITRTIRYARSIINTVSSSESETSACSSIGISLAVLVSVADAVAKCIE